MRRSGVAGSKERRVPKELNAITSAIEAHVERLHTEIEPLQRGEVRHASRLRNGAWQDRTEETVHDKRNLLATLEALLVLIRQR
jgi:hypothetical protein